MKFEVDDVESEWTYDFNFDYIFCRYMAASIADWPKLVERIYQYVHDFLASQRGMTWVIDVATTGTLLQVAGLSSRIST